MESLYIYGKTATDPRCPVDNTLASAFEFRDGLIVTDHDRSNAMAGAWQTFPFPKSLIVGLIAPLRRKAVKKRLDGVIEASRRPRPLRPPPT